MSEGKLKPTSSTPLVPCADILPAPLEDRNADTILRTSDGIDIRVYRAVLSLTSNVFSQMFQRAQAAGEAEIPVIPVQESAPILVRLFSLFYPGMVPVVLTGLEPIREIFDVAFLKYEMLSLARSSKRDLRARIHASPVAVYALACRYAWKDVAAEAAKASLSLSLHEFDSAPPAGLQYTTADSYHALLQYFHECRTAAKRATDSLEWLAWSPKLPWFNCSEAPNVCPNSAETWDLADYLEAQMTQWFIAYLKSAGEALWDRPGARLDTAELLDGPIKAMSGCPMCSRTGFKELIKFARETLPEKVAEEVDAIEVKLNFSECT